jgi:ATP-dependent helicase/nuclease subunit A
MKNITIYKASAGSGKTFTLVRDFLLVLFDNPLKYRQVLAVTFTNKATAEMKSRLIEELYRLSRGEKTGHFEAIKERFPDKSDEKIVQVSTFLLTEILNNYSHFFISTIDRFFQYVIKSFAKELGIYGNYSIELDSVSVLHEAVEQLFLDLEKDEHSTFMEWLTRFVEEQVEDGKSYSVTNDIVELGKQLFNENFKSEREELFRIISDKKQLNLIRTDLKNRVSELEKRFKEFGDKGLRIMEHFGVTRNDFKYKATSGVNLFEKLSKGETNGEKLLNTRVNDLMESDDNWPDKKGLNVSAACAARDSGLKQLLFDFIDFLARENRFLLSYNAILKNFFTLGILSDLHTAVRSYAAERNLLLLADSNELLAGVIGQNDAPFIYEKAGNRFEHFMIDEFQDTSNLQWNNFKPLLQNSLAQGFGNMLVGDVKQAIYRWRNSDWRLLGHDIYNDFRPDTVETKNLPVNWRSAGDIVRFNNRFFEVAPKVALDILKNEIESFSHTELEMLTSAYSNASQEVATKNEEVEGHVSIKFFAHDDEASKDSTMNEIIAIVEDVQKRGYTAGDIVILARTNNVARDISKFMLDYKNESKALPNVNYNVISDEALVLGSNDTVRFIVNLLLFETQFKNPVVAAELNFFLRVYAPDVYGEHDSLWQVHPHIEKVLGESKHLSLNEKADGVIRAFQLDKNGSDRIYIETLRDFINEFMRRNGSDTVLFAEVWSRNGIRKSIQSPGTGDAIRIMTIHKSKGLEFPVVIIPFFEWSMGIDSRTTSVTWCSVHEELNLPIPVLPVKLTKTLGRIAFWRCLKDRIVTDFYR